MTQTPDPYEAQFGTLLWRGLRLKCPACGEGAMTKTWFRTEHSCSSCEFDFRVETGFYLGSIYLNYGLTAAIGLAIGFPLYLNDVLSPVTLTIVGLVYCIAFSMWFFPYARSLWLGLDYYLCRESRGLGDRGKPIEADELFVLELNGESKELNRFTCPFCHRKYWFRQQGAGSWKKCPYCRTDVLLK